MPHSAADRAGLRLIAVWELVSGLLVLVVGSGLLRLMHQNLQHLAEQLVLHLHLNPASHYPRIFIDLAGSVSSKLLWALAALAACYAGLHFVVAYGLWRQRQWAEWVSVAGAAIYLPLELQDLGSGVSGLKLLVLTVNVAIVGYLGLALWRRRRVGV